MRGIIAVNNLGYIGLDGELPWKSSEDLKHFKKLTMGDPVLVGYRTYETLPPLKGRKILLDDVNRHVTMLDKTIDDIPFDYYKDGDGLWCIGGKKTYERYADFFDELHISHIDDNTIGDTMFPDFSRLNPDCKVVNYYFGTD